MEGRRSFMEKFLKAGVAGTLGMTAIEAWRQPETRLLLGELSGSLARPVPAVGPRADSSPRRKAPAPTPLPGENDYGEYIESLGLRHISPHEIFSAHRRNRNGISNSLPPKELWTRITPTLKAADELRHRLGVPLTYITSAYRSPAYNRQCPGAAKYSQHMENRALDLVYACPPEDAFKEACRMRGEGSFKGGLGLYSSFIHIDTRGRNATWGA